MLRGVFGNDVHLASAVHAMIFNKLGLLCRGGKGSQVPVPWALQPCSG